MPIRCIVAALLFVAGTAIVALPIVMRLGFLLGATGVIFGPVVGVMAGVLWASASSANVGGTVVPAVEAPQPSPA